MYRGCGLYVLRWLVKELGGWVGVELTKGLIIYTNVSIYIWRYVVKL